MLKHQFSNYCYRCYFWHTKTPW